MADKEIKKENSDAKSFGSYNIIKNRIQEAANDLKLKLDKLNEQRVLIFGENENKLLTTEPIITENNCVPRDIISFGNTLIFGYNVHMGLKTTVEVSDVFSVYNFNDGKFNKGDMGILSDPSFIKEFQELYKFYKDSFFAKFFKKDGFLHLVFQTGADFDSIKTFKWHIDGDRLIYVGNRFAHEVVYPNQQEVEWIKTVREDHKFGLHPHVSIKDKVFVETIGGDLTLKIEDNTNVGSGIYAEPVDHEQQLDDALIYYSFVGNLILLKIKPYQEQDFRYLIFNEKTKDVYRVDSIEKSVTLLPDNHGIIFPDGICLQSGGFKKFDINIDNVVLHNKKTSLNGEDYQYIYYDLGTGEYYIHTYNLISQKIDTPIISNGYTHLPDGTMLVFKADNEPKRSHSIRIWKTSFYEDGHLKEVDSEFKDNFLFTLGNKEIVKLMADCSSLYNLLNKDDSYYGLYVDIFKDSDTIINNYFWINKEEAFRVDQALSKIKESSAIAIKEFDKITKLKEQAKRETAAVKEKTTKLLKDISYAKIENINDFVYYLDKLRELRGVIASLKDFQFVDLTEIDKLANEVKEKNSKLSEDCINFLMGENSLAPYEVRVGEIETKLETITKVVDGKELEESINSSSHELELLINIVSNLKIADTTKSSEIIDKISVLFSKLNQVRSKLINIIKNLDLKEMEAEFYSKIGLLTHTVSNYLGLSTSIEKCEEYLGKIIVTIDELESKFSDFDEFIPVLAEKREEVISTFEANKQQLREKKSKKIDSLGSAADRIFKGISNRVKSLESIEAINQLFSTDLMIEKIRDISENLVELGDATKADDIINKLKTLKENSVRQLKDKKELFLDGNTIKFGKNNFLVNNQKAELSFLRKNDDFYFHISGTDFWEVVPKEKLIKYKDVWNQEIVSENSIIYRAEYLAYNIFNTHRMENRLNNLFDMGEDELKNLIKQYLENHYAEYYTKGVHDVDGFKILSALINKYMAIDLAYFDPKDRAVAIAYWNYGIEDKRKNIITARLKSINNISKFSSRDVTSGFIDELSSGMDSYLDENNWLPKVDTKLSANYLAKELSKNSYFLISKEGQELFEEFTSYITGINGKSAFNESLSSLKDDVEGRYIVISEWIKAFYHEKGLDINNYFYELAITLLCDDKKDKRSILEDLNIKIPNMVGVHNMVVESSYKIDIVEFFNKLTKFKNHDVILFNQFQEDKSLLISDIRKRLKFDELEPKVLTSFVRNKLIDQVYLPLIGDNLAKQIGAAGENKRTDNMGMLLMISPPGYGKTTLVEYITNRLNMTLVKINCPTIGHGVTSLDPAEATNVNAAEELKKLNLALEIGNNVMIYLDDIQHSNPEFLQKFISLCDGTRKIEGIYNGVSKTYDFRGKKLAVMMAGNPYTESGDKFQIPDMLSNRADVYNLGDMMRENEEAFKLSYIENAMTSNPVLNRIYMKNPSDLYALLNGIKTGDHASISLEATYTESEKSEAIKVLENLVKIRDEILMVNMEYIRSASINDDYRTEPAFKLQGSYRNMNKIAEKVQPIMNPDEIDGLIVAGYENDAQTLASDAESSLLKFRELTGRLSEEQLARWNEIKSFYNQGKDNAKDNAVFKIVEELNRIGGALDKFSDGKLSIEVNPKIVRARD